MQVSSPGERSASAEKSKEMIEPRIRTFVELLNLFDHNFHLMKKLNDECKLVNPCTLLLFLDACDRRTKLSRKETSSEDA